MGPDESFQIAEGIEFIVIDKKTGLKAAPGCFIPDEDIMVEAFSKDNLPPPCSEKERYRIELPYYLQEFRITDDYRLLVPDESALFKMREQGMCNMIIDPYLKQIRIPYGPNADQIIAYETGDGTTIPLTPWDLLARSTTPAFTEHQIARQNSIDDLKEGDIFEGAFVQFVKAR